MRTVEQTLSLIKELSETNYNGPYYTRYLEQELRTAIEELHRDAARYRAVRRGQKWSVIDGIGDTLRADDLDASIDAAREST